MNFTYELTYVRGKRSVSITVKDGAVSVRAPKGMNAAEVERVVRNKAEWIEKKLAEQARDYSENRQYIEYAKFLLLGKAYDTFEAFKAAVGGKSKTAAKLYSSAAKMFLERRLLEISKALGIVYKEFALTNSKVKWGSCGANGKVLLNWRLMLLPPDLIDYVIVHELCHFYELNHSRAFWDGVAKVLPDYKIREKAMKRYGFAMRLFR